MDRYNGWSRKSLLKFLKHLRSSDFEVVYDNDNIVMIEAVTYSAADKLCGKGRASLLPSEWQFHEERRKMSRYFFLFNFNLRLLNDALSQVLVRLDIKDHFGEIRDVHGDWILGHYPTSDSFANLEDIVHVIYPQESPSEIYEENKELLRCFLKKNANKSFKECSHIYGLPIYAYFKVEKDSSSIHGLLHGCTGFVWTLMAEGNNQCRYDAVEFELIPSKENFGVFQLCAKSMTDYHCLQDKCHELFTPNGDDNFINISNLCEISDEDFCDHVSDYHAAYDRMLKVRRNKLFKGLWE